MADSNINIKIDVETSAAQKSLDQLNSKATDISSSISGAFNAIGIAAAAALAFAASKEIIGFFANGISAAQDQEKAMASLGQQLKLTGSFSREAIDDFNAFAETMESTTIFGDDLVVSQLAVAKSFGVSNEQAKELVKAAANLSAVTGDSLDSSVEQLGKTLSGNVPKSAALKAALSGLSEEALRSGDAFAKVNERFSGSAAAQIDGYTGALTQAGNAFGDFQKAAGSIVTNNQAVIDGIQAITFIFDALEKTVKDNSGVIDEFITGAVNAIATGVPIAVNVLGILIKGFQFLVQAGTLAFGGLLEVVGAFAKIWDKTIGNVVRLNLFLFESLGGSGEARKAFDEFTKGAIGGIESLANSTAEFGANNVGRFDSFNAGFEKFQDTIDTAAISVIAADKKIVESAKDSSNENAEARKSVAKAAIKSADDIKKAAADAAAFEKTIRDATLTEEQKIVAKREENLKKLATLAKTYGPEKTAALRIEIEKDTVAKLEALAQKNADTAIAESKRQSDAEIAETDRKLKIIEDKFKSDRARLDAIASNPIIYFVELAKIKPLDLSQGAKEAIVAGTALAGKLLEGADVAKGIKEAADQGAKDIEEAKKLSDASIGGANKAALADIANLNKSVKDDFEAAKKKAEILIREAELSGDQEKIAAAQRKANDILEAEKIAGAKKLADGQLKIQDQLNESKAKSEGEIIKVQDKAIEEQIKAQEATDKQARANVTGIISSVGAGFADALLPGLGAAVGPLLTVLTSGPDAIKSFIKSLVEAVPDLITAIAESIPVVVEALIEYLVTKGGAVKIGIAIVKGIVTASFGIVEALANAIFGGIGTDIGDQIFNAVEEAAIKIKEGFIQPLLQIDQTIRSALFNGAQSLFNAIVNGAQQLFQVDQKIRQAFVDAAFGLVSSITGVFSGFKFPKIEIPQTFIDFKNSLNVLKTTPSWVQTLLNALQALGDFIADLTGQGGNGGFLSTGKTGNAAIDSASSKINKANPFKARATGQTIIPPGFPDDTFGPVGLTSGERILSAPQNTDLTGFLDSQDADDGGVESRLDLVASLLSQLVAGMQQGASGTSEITLKIDGRTLAKELVNIDRRNLRTTA